MIFGNGFGTGGLFSVATRVGGVPTTDFSSLTSLFFKTSTQMLAHTHWSTTWISAHSTPEADIHPLSGGLTPPTLSLKKYV